MIDFSPLFTALRDQVLQESEITINSLGNPIHSTEQGIENFWKWFSHSVMKNRKGQPCVFYHGSSYIFNKFIPQQIIGQFEDDKAVFFSTKKEFSDEFAQTRLDDDGRMQANKIPGAEKSDQKQIYECYLRCKKPFNFRNKNCIDQFINYIDGVQNRRNKDNIIVKSAITGAYPYNFIDDFDKAQVNDIVMIKSPSQTCSIIGHVENDMVPYRMEKINNEYWWNKTIIFHKGEKSLLVYNIEFLNEDKLPKDKVILTRNSEIINRIKSSGISFKGSDEKKIPFNLLISSESYPLDKEKIQVNIVVYKIFANKELAPLHKYQNNWQEIESLIINPDLSFVQVIKNLGYDSFFTLEDGSLNIVVFNANDIKSVNNDGTFSESDKILS